jgi:hypothetical protein
MKKLLLIFFSLSLILIGCVDRQGSDNSNDSIKSKSSYDTNAVSANPKIIKHNIPNSFYYYDVEITKVETVKIKNALKRQKEKFDVPVEIDGINLIVFYTIKNPYNKEMLVPVPDYFYITSDTFNESTENTIYHRSCKCYIDNSTTITYNGKELYEVCDKKEEDSYFFKFKPMESKEFKVFFYNPIPFDIPSFTFMGFMGKSSKDTEGTYSIEIGANIDMKTMSVISQQQYER